MSKGIRFDQLAVGESFTIFPNRKALVWTKQTAKPDKGENAIDEQGKEFKFEGNQYVYKRNEVL